jgi:hypothetical protein
VMNIKNTMIFFSGYERNCLSVGIVFQVIEWCIDDCFDNLQVSMYFIRYVGLYRLPREAGG